ncbi:hypothetical protein [Schleiferilactobacillus harbinensis]|uniref:Uncharacterized protein n=1 Tax=Schleiferilactobacillus harbinensis TaxID=304207 RepID=A0A5P8M125_9LACO|nr:hypothetical protein [Schleiferilactobacillus harbinensis]QFR22178.1 hypothetical protein D1010_01230 [Schleiferilactobacillus harbinensis]
MFKNKIHGAMLLMICLFAVLLFIPSGNPTKVMANANQSPAISAFMRSKAYQQVKEKIGAANPQIVKPTFDSDGNKNGELMVYPYSTEQATRIAANSSIKGEMTTEVLSPLTVFYDSKSDQVTHVVLLDYSTLGESSSAISITDFVTGEKSTVTPEQANVDADALAKDIRQKQATTVKDIEKKQQKLVAQSQQPKSDKKQAAPSAIVSCNIFTCTSYATGGGYRDGTCDFVNGAICGKMPTIFSSIVCVGAQAWGCYVPKYKVCAAGFWKYANACPVNIN